MHSVNWTLKQLQDVVYKCGCKHICECVNIGNKINSNKTIYLGKIEEMRVYFIDTCKILFYWLIFLFPKQVKTDKIFILNHYISKFPAERMDWLVS